jgi:hypothetical protein
MLNVIRTACALALLGITPAYAGNYIRIFVPNAEKVGQGRLSVMLWDVYDAVLYAPEGRWQRDQPFALQLSYLRDIPGKKIADRSIEEIREQGFTDEVRLADWHAQMRSIFPDVHEGVSLTGVFTNTGETIFYEDDREIGRIKDPQFGRQFFNIWLSPQTSAPDLRRKLLGQL